MTNLLAQLPALQLFAPALVAAGIALSLVIMFRVAATLKFRRALQTNANWAPPIPTELGSSHPLNQVHRRITLSELLSPSQAEFSLHQVEFATAARSPADSGEITRPFIRVG